LLLQLNIHCTPNRHGIVGYLGDGTVAKKIIEHLL